MTTLAIVAIAVLAYFIAGMVTAVMTVLNEGEPPADDRWMLLVAAVIWPIVLLIDGPVWIARWIKARQAARRDKPAVFSDYDEENR